MDKGRRVKRLVTVVIFLLCVLIMAAIIVRKVSEDKAPPVITIDDDSIVLTKDEIGKLLERDYTCLLNGVTAEDHVDGDITDKVIVYSYETYDDDSYAIVKYKVMDKSGNTANAKRLVYIKTPHDIYYDTLKRDNGPADEVTNGQSNNSDLKEGAPVLEMVSEITVKAGDAFDVNPYIIQLWDDKDSAEYLMSHGRYEGELNLEVEGVYPMVFYVTDSDGNESAPAVCVVTVTGN